MDFHAYNELKHIEENQANRTKIFDKQTKRKKRNNWKEYKRKISECITIFHWKSFKPEKKQQRNESIGIAENKREKSTKTKQKSRTKQQNSLFEPAQKREEKTKQKWRQDEHIVWFVCFVCPWSICMRRDPYNLPNIQMHFGHCADIDIDTGTFLHTHGYSYSSSHSYGNRVNAFVPYYFISVLNSLHDWIWRAQHIHRERNDQFGFSNATNETIDHVYPCV